MMNFFCKIYTEEEESINLNTLYNLWISECEKKNHVKEVLLLR